MTEEEEIQLTVDLQSGMRDGEKISFEAVADEAVGHISGDLIFTVQQLPHQSFIRDGDNLFTTIQITLLEALVGFSKSFEHVDGHAVVINKKDVTYCGEMFAVKGEGIFVFIRLFFT